MNAEVSVIVPLYNAERYIKKTLDCILSQTYKKIEILICDDASEDHSLSIVNATKDTRIRLLQNKENRGIAYTRNKLVENAKGEYIALWDDDDLSPLDRIELEVDMVRRADADIIFGHWYEVDKKGKQISPVYYIPKNPKYLRARQLLNNMPGNGTALIRKEFITKHNISYRENMFGAEDYRLWAECLINDAKFATVDEVLMHHRVHEQNASLSAIKFKRKDRDRIIADIQKYTLINMGFHFQKEEFALLGSIFRETGIVVESMSQLEALRHIFRAMIEQAYSMKLDNAQEIQIMCRKLFGDVVGQARFLWEPREIY